MTHRTSDREGGASGPLLAESWSVLAAGGLAAWFWVTVLGNHPQHSMERARRIVGPFTVALPNWRFFAPNPAAHDFAVVYRTRSGGEISPWSVVHPPMARLWRNVVFYPGRRERKSVFDASVSIVRALQVHSPEVVPHSVAYQVLRENVRRAATAAASAGDLPEEFQFAILRHAGHAEEVEPEHVVVSPFSATRNASR